MQIILLLAGLIGAAYLVRKYTTVCPNCGAVGKFKDLGRRRVGTDRSWSSRSRQKKTGKTTVVHNERYQCTACGEKFSKTVRSRTGRRN